MIKNSFKPLAVLVLRGGLGNQLHQVCAMARMSRERDFHVLITDINTFHLNRGSGGTEIFELEIDSWFSKPQKVFLLQERGRYFLRILFALNRLLGVPKFLNEESLKTIDRLPPLFIVQDYFQSKEYPDFFSVEQLKNVLTSKKTSNPFICSEQSVGVHIRLQDFLHIPESYLDSSYYLKAISHFVSQNMQTFDCYSDDIFGAKQMLCSLDNLEINYMKSPITATSIDLLISMSKHPYFVCSKSSLCWWARYLHFRENMVNHDFHCWPEKLSF